MTDLIYQMFPGVSTFFAMEPAVAAARGALILLGFASDLNAHWSP